MKIEAIICVLVGIGLIFFSGTPYFTNSETKNIILLIGAVTVGAGLLIFWLFREPDRQIIYHRGL